MTADALADSRRIHLGEQEGPQLSICCEDQGIWGSCVQNQEYPRMSGVDLEKMTRKLISAV